MRKIIAVGKCFQEKHKERLKRCAAENGFEIQFFNSNEDAYTDLPDAEIVYGQGIDLYRGCVNAKWFCSLSAGVDQYLQKGTVRDNIMLSNSSGAYGLTIAEHTIMVILELLRRRKEYYDIVERKEWIRNLSVSSIYGSRIAIVGTGNIGTEIAKRLQAFSPASIIGVNRSGKAAGCQIFSEIIKQDNIDKILPQIDILIMAIPGTPETYHFLSKDKLTLLPKTSYIVNVGRGSVIDETELLDALTAHRIAGAALDVFEQEPLPKDHPFWDCPQLIVTPHISGDMSLSHTTDINVEQFCRDLEHYSSGEPLEHAINIKAGY